MVNAKHYNIPIFIPHLGCPFQCIFCNQKHIASREPAPDEEQVRRVLNQALSTISAPGTLIEAAFFGGSFTAIDRTRQQRYLQTVQPYIEQKRIHGIRISTRPDFISPEILGFLKNYGVTTIELGVQSLDKTVLQKTERGYRPEQAIHACRLIKQERFKLGVQLMVGLPGDSPAADRETVQQVIALKPDMVRIYPTLVITNSELEQMYQRGEFHPLGLEEAVTITCDMFLQFQEHDIPVIRMGLHPAEELRESGTILDGPFHPAFGELVEQEAFKRQARILIQVFLREKSESSVRLFVHPRDLSKMLGQKRSNIAYLQQACAVQGIEKVGIDADLDRDEIGIAAAGSLRPESRLKRKEFIARCSS